jgi:hypothetical protein
VTTAILATLTEQAERGFVPLSRGFIGIDRVQLGIDCLKLNLQHPADA